MATIAERKRVSGKKSFTAQVRIKKDGKVVFTEAQTFAQRRLAEAWAKRVEEDWRAGRRRKPTDKEPTFSDLIRRYRQDIENDIGKTVVQCLRTLEEMEETKRAHSEVDAGFLIDLGRTLKDGGRTPATVNNYMQHLFGLFAVAEDAYGASLKAPAASLRHPRRRGAPTRRP